VVYSPPLRSPVLYLPTWIYMLLDILCQNLRDLHRTMGIFSATVHYHFSHVLSASRPNLSTTTDFLSQVFRYLTLYFNMSNPRLLRVFSIRPSSNQSPTARQVFAKDYFMTDETWEDVCNNAQEIDFIVIGSGVSGYHSSDKTICHLILCILVHRLGVH
jgi:hypothetical protein